MTLVIDTYSSSSSSLTSASSFNQPELELKQINLKDVIKLSDEYKTFYVSVLSKDDECEYESFIINSMRNLKSIEYVFELDEYNDKIAFLTKKYKNSISKSKPVIAFDLDETLIYSQINNNKPNIKIDFSISSLNITGRIRPGAFELLNFLKSQGFSLVVYSAGERAYVEKTLEVTNLKSFFELILSREDCICLSLGLNKQNLYIKDLRILDNEQSVLIDNNFISFGNNLSSAVLVNSYNGEDDDMELFDILSYINEHSSYDYDLKKLFTDFFRFSYIYTMI